MYLFSMSHADKCRQFCQSPRNCLVSRSNVTCKSMGSVKNSVGCLFQRTPVTDAFPSQYITGCGGSCGYSQRKETSSLCGDNCRGHIGCPNSHKYCRPDS